MYKIHWCYGLKYWKSTNGLCSLKYVKTLFITIRCWGGWSFFFYFYPLTILFITVISFMLVSIYWTFTGFHCWWCIVYHFGFLVLFVLFWAVSTNNFFFLPFKEENSVFISLVFYFFMLFWLWQFNATEKIVLFRFTFGFYYFTWILYWILLVVFYFSSIFCEVFEWGTFVMTPVGPMIIGMPVNGSHIRFMLIRGERFDLILTMYWKGYIKTECTYLMLSL